MLTLKNDNVVMVDVDETLIIAEYPLDQTDGLIDINGVVCLPHFKHIKLLKDFASRGHLVVVWSQGGWKWAETVVRALELSEWVDLIITKPKWHIDDLPSRAYMGDPIYIHLDGRKQPWTEKQY